MKKRFILPIIILVVSLAAGAVLVSKFSKNKVGHVSENPNIPAFIDNLMFKEKQKLIIESDNTTEAARLAKLGFNKTGQVFDPYTAKALLTLYQVYEAIYPNQQFVNFKCIDGLIKEYGLSLGSAERFIANVPQYAIDSMEHFKPSYIYSRDLVEEGFMSLQQLSLLNNGYGHRNYFDWYLKDVYTHIINGGGPLPNKDSNLVTYSLLDMKMRKGTTQFLVVAPKEYFSGEPNRNGTFIKIKDPIVLAPVVGGYIIVCSW